MRLTLRTLLAYIDDTLPPQQTREIGQKVAENDAARELIARIRTVTRRRRLTTPEMAGASDANVDPNIVAEYLDNELTPEKLEELEKLCLESDVNLAEVAACHQILTVILGEPAKVPPTAFQRMYSLVKGREAVPTRRPPTVAASAVEEEARDTHDETDEALLLGMPPYQRGSPWLRRLIPIAAAVLLVVCLAGILYVASQGERRRPELVEGRRAVPKGTSPEQPLVKAGNEKSPAKPTDVPPPPEPASPVAEPLRLWAGWVAHAGKDVPEGPSFGSVPMWSSWVATRPGLPVALFVALTPGEGDRGVPVEPPPPQPIVRTIPPPSPAQVVVGQFVLSKDKDAAPALLVRQAASDDVRFVRPDAKVRTAEWLLALPGYRDDIQLDSKLRLSLVGSLPSVQENLFYECAVMLHDNPELALDMTLDRGRTVIVNRPAGEAQVRLRFLDQAWDVKLLQPESRIGFEVHGRVPRGTGDWTPHVKVGLLVTGGPVELTRDGKTEHIAAGKVFVWDRPALNRTPGLLVDLKETPTWLKDKSAYPNDVRSALVQVQERMSRKPQIGEEKTPWVAITCEESLPENAMWQRWVGLFGLGSLDQMKGVVKALDEGERHDMRFAALDTLRNWIGRKSNQDQPLRALLQQREYSSEDAELLLQYLRGYDQFSAPTVRQLLASLNNPRLVIRELALANLNMIAPPDKLADFRNLPLAPPEVREKAIETLEGRLLPKP